MLLVIDIGNSTTKFGIFKGSRITRTWSVDTPDLPAWRPKKSISDLPVIAASVVPSADKVLKKRFKKIRFVSAMSVAGMRIGFKNRSEIGADRIVDAYAALNLYGSPAIVIDFGTATTFDIISKRGDYLGGAIAPGIGLSRKALYYSTSKLPLIEIKAPKDIIGGSTVEAMRSGLVIGYAAMVEGMIARFKRKIGKGARVVATGGFAKLIAKYAAGIDIIDADLTLKGLNMIWQKN